MENKNYICRKRKTKIDWFGFKKLRRIKKEIFTIKISNNKINSKINLLNHIYIKKIFNLIIKDKLYEISMKDPKVWQEIKK